MGAAEAEPSAAFPGLATLHGVVQGPEVAPLESRDPSLKMLKAPGLHLFRAGVVFASAFIQAVCGKAAFAMEKVGTLGLWPGGESITFPLSFCLYSKVAMWERGSLCPMSCPKFKGWAHTACGKFRLPVRSVVGCSTRQFFFSEGAIAARLALLGKSVQEVRDSPSPELCPARTFSPPHA